MKHVERRRLLVKEAGRIFDDGIARNPSDAYSYLGRFNIIRYHALELEPSADERNRLKADALSLLEEASEATGESEIIAVALADQRRQMGDFRDAVKMLTAALNTKPENARLRDLLLRYLSSASRYKEALKIALAGIKFDPNSWRLQRHVARLMRANGYKLAPIRGAYEAAVRHNKGDLGLLVEFAAFLFTHSILADAEDIFGEAKRLKTLSDKRQIREWWCDEGNKRKIFTGKLKRFQGATGYAEAFPENFEAFFWRTEAWIAELREGDPVQFQVGFNAYGPVAKILLQNRR